MTLKRTIGNWLQHEGLNFLLTNRLPRAMATHAMGRLSKVRHPLVSVPSLWAFRFFADDLRLHEARKTRFDSLHDCFVRQLREGVRPVDASPDALVSPCDAIVGALGTVTEGLALQLKGSPYGVSDLLVDRELARIYEGGLYVTLRLQASMYHRFHAPHDCRVERLAYVSGDTWNVNPVALKRIERLFVKNERAVLTIRLDRGDHMVTLVPVAAILVASMRFTFTDVRFHLRYRGPNTVPVDAAMKKGDEMGHFEHGSSIVLFAPPGFRLIDGVAEGRIVRMGEALMRVPQ
jgi:phosphatidylserine decarboxylase